jgi:hypothetical protein
MRAFRTLGATALALVVAVGVAPPVLASAPASAVTTWSSTVQVVTTADAIQSTPVADAGPVKFQVSTQAVNSGWIGVVKLSPGATWEQFQSTYKKLGSTDRAVILEGSRELANVATLLGGVQTRVGGPGSFTVNLAAGSYLLFDHQDFRTGAADPRRQPLTVLGSGDGGETGTGTDTAASATLTAVTIPGVGPRYSLSGAVRVGQPIRFVNTMPGQAVEAILWQLQPGVTDADIRAWIDLFGDTGQFPTQPPPFASSEPAGLLPMSSYKSYSGVPPLQQGRYVVLNWMKDAMDGTMLLKKGMFRILDVG